MEYSEAYAALMEALKQWQYWAARHPRTMDYLSDMVTCDKGMDDAKKEMHRIIDALHMS